MEAFAYLPGEPVRNQLLGRFLPPIPRGVASKWLDSHISKGSLLLDPLGASPIPVIEAARIGYRVLVTANNPIMRLLLEVSATAANKSELQSTLALLAGMRLRDERIETHIRSLYITNCDQCGSSVPVDAFLWNSKSGDLYGRIYRCQHCGESGEHPASEMDRQRATQFTVDSMHHSRALARVAPLSDPDRVYAEEALSFYPPRAVYVLIQLINKLDGLQISDSQRIQLFALLLAAFDQGNTLWLHPTARQRPRQLTIPPLYRENNIWLALENAIEQLSTEDPPVLITAWPELPPAEGGICLYQGPIRLFAEEFHQTKIGAVIMAVPRPNQAFWTLSALWAGWLWGHEAVQHFKSVLRRQRYGWGWHTTALQAAFENLQGIIQENTPIFGLTAEAEPGLLTASLMAGYLGGFKLRGIASRTDQEMVQIHWQSDRELQSTQKGDVTEIEIATCLAEAAIQQINERSEPTEYLSLHVAGLLALLKKGLVPETDSLFETYTQIQKAFQSGMTYGKGLLRFGGSEKNFEIGQWWLQNPASDRLPLADRVEIEMVKYLIANPGCSFNEIDQALCQMFRGLQTPERKLIEVLLESYGEQDQAGDGWHLRDTDAPTKRRADIADLVRLISQMGTFLGFESQQDEGDPTSVSWQDEDGSSIHLFVLHASAAIGKTVSQEQADQGQKWLVIPGGRANLMIYKLNKNLALQQQIDQGWNFIKFRHIRRLAEDEGLNRVNLETKFSLDPLTYSEPQLRLL